MDLGFRLNLENPKKKVGIFSRLFFGWVVPLIKRGVNEGLKLENLYKVLKKDKSRDLTNKLEEHWDNEVRKSQEKNRKPSLLKALCKQFYGEFVIYGVVWFYTNVIVICLRPIILAQLIKLFADKDVNKNYLMYVYSVALILTSLLSTMSLHHMNFAMQAIGMRVRVATSSLIYRKITRLNHKSLGETPAGKVVNILSNDLSRFDLAIPVIHAIWVMPFQVIVIFLIIWQQVGIAAVSGIVTMVLLTVPVQGFLAKYVGKLRTSVSKKTDIRVKLMSEIVSGIQVIKMYAWEKPFEKLVEHTRASEMKDISSASFVRGLYASTMIFSDKLSLFTTLITYVLLGNIISADRVFSMAQSFGILQLAMAVVYPLAVSIGAEALISIRRLEEFLSLEEKDDEDIIRGPRKTGVTISYVDASWTDMGCTLEDINIRIRPGTLCAIVGPVGSGKSSLLQLLTGELPTLCGGIEIGGEISYSAQQPWLFQSTVRNNIIFGNHYDKNLYKRVVKVCALESDFEQFPHGDRTIVGEKGVSLSGGQRARINLARAVYRKADIYLLDDPLSAVDIHVGKQLFNECIYEFLKGKTRILVTHQLQYLKKADLIIVLNDGMIEAQGTFEELSNCNLDFTKILVAADETEENINEDADTDLANSDTEECRKFSITSSTKMSLMSVSSSDMSEKGTNQIIEEKSGDGPNSKPFKNYLASVKYNSLVVLVIFLLISSQALIVGIDQWLTLWTSQEQIRHSNTTIIIQIHQDLFNNTNGYNNGSLHPSDYVNFFNKFNDSQLFNRYNEEVKKNYIDNNKNLVQNHEQAIKEYTFFDKNNDSVNTNHSFYNKNDKRIEKRQSSFDNNNVIANNNYRFINKPNNINKKQEFFESKNNTDKKNDNNFNKREINNDHEFFENKNDSDKNHNNISNKPDIIEKEHGFLENKNNSDKNHDNISNISNKPGSIEKDNDLFKNKYESDKNDDNISNKPDIIEKEHGFFENKNESDKNPDNISNKPDSIEKDHGLFENNNNGIKNNDNIFNKRENTNKDQELFENKNNSDKNHDNIFNRPDGIEKDHGFFENKNYSDKNHDNISNRPDSIEKEHGFFENKNNSHKNHDNISNRPDSIEKEHGFSENKSNSDKNNKNIFNMRDNINKNQEFFENKNNSDKNNDNNFNKGDNINKDQELFENNSDKNYDNIFNRPNSIEKEHGFFENKNNSDKSNGNIINKLDNINRENELFKNKNNDNVFYRPENNNKEFFGSKNDGATTNVDLFSKPHNITNDEHNFFDHHNFSVDTKNIHNISIDNSTMNAWNRIIRKLHVHDILSYVTLNVNSMFDYVIADGTLQRLYKTEPAMYIYGTMIILVILLVLSRTFLFFTSSVMASENLHSMMFNKLLKAPMRFFDTNPSGRILNRFSKDVGCIDEILPRVLLDSISIFLVMAGILVNIVIASPIMIIALVILGALYLKFRSWYMVTAKTLKHLEGITKSPVFSHVSSTLCGIVTIRASHSEDILIDEFDRHQDVHTSAWYLTLASMNAFGIWLDLIVLVFLSIVTFSFVILTSFTNVNGSSVGLAVSQCMVLTGMLQYGMKQLAEVINNLTSVERILQYTTLENEGPFETPKEKRPKGTWPRRGNVEFKKLYLKYVQNDPPILKNLNIVFKPGEKIGIVGRTGAGKSSLISALFRLAPLEGSLLIDRVDINNLGLTDLRRKISIIPQEPVLFSETLRYNLDPFNEFDDDKIWDTLELVEMKETVESLDFLVAEGGSNLSLGQRQLICLARAILKENKILVLDEATANVDHKTDSLIQGTIRKVFKDCTVLTIAHRLNTIMDSDKVLVMSFGNVVEFDHPHNLLQIEDGYFHKMVLETSPNMAQELKNIAQNAYLKHMEEKDD